MWSEASERKRVGASNPNPASDPEIPDPIMDQLCLSPEKLKILSRSDNLQEVKTLEMCGHSTGHPPQLRNALAQTYTAENEQQFDLICAYFLRDLGTSLSRLQVLWLARCGLTDLEGIPNLYNLKELYVAYNSISDLSPVSLLEHLELLDLEGNDVDDLAQFLYLGCCEKLRSLSLEGNPVCSCPSPGMSEVLDYNYRSAVHEMIPQLSLLDDAPAEEDKPQACTTSLQDWTLLKESIKDTSVINDLEQINTDTEERSVSVCGVRPASAQVSDLRISSRSLSSCPGSARPLTSCTGPRPGLSGSDIAILNHEASDLTKGVGSVLCGNPLQAARVRKQKIKLQNSHSQTRPSTRLSSYVPEHTYDCEESSSKDRGDVSAELRSWRIEHNRHLLAIEKDWQPQVMRIHHSDDEYDDEGRHSHSFCSDDVTKDRTVRRDSSSPDSSFQSPSPASSSDCSMSPSPPPNAAAPPAGRRITQIRTRRLRPHYVDTSEPRLSEETPGTDLRNVCPLSIKTVSSQTVSPQIFHKPHRPSASPAVSPLIAKWSVNTGNHQCLDIQHKPITVCKASEKLTPRRPRTAKAALQSVPDPNLLSSQRNAHLE